MNGQKFEFEQNEISIGRSDQNVISLDNPAASGKHCAVIRDGNKYSIRDLHSTNGTRLNGRNVVEARLKPGDIITVGGVEITIDGPDIEAEPTPEPITRASSTPTVILAPHAVSGTPPSPAFQVKRSNKPVKIAIIIAVFALVAAAAAWFLINVMK